jgi:hypothetical protein
MKTGKLSPDWLAATKASASRSISAVMQDHVMRLQLLDTNNSRKARALAIEVLPKKIGDQAICDKFEELITDAVCAGNHDFEVPTDLALWVAVILKSRPRHRGGQWLSRFERKRRRVISNWARELKAEYVKDGKSATEAESDAAARVAKELLARGVKISAETVRRLMQSPPDN